ncbi:2e425200-ef6e-47ec-ade5-0f5dbdc5d652 [Sclerotinia trifoliorum]|uniref:2e425200-ef6e-47ec-ade5-0f5dbdc5d652 n=1 Tax=Sclerotinia trifoliorum TaxID=28548 RepID=A0A8H2VR57_9HELO|nr:2e425200-ef6e-47ec-ade5-0f5dbdc5d652 [Sclerotinia trifoliorum]
MQYTTNLLPIPSLLLLLTSQIQQASANTEKAIFLGPSALQIPAAHPTLSDLHLSALSPQHHILRTHIDAEFPTSNSKYGQSSWYLLQGLEEGQRYEVRVCWAATDPTSFRLNTYDLTAVFETPELITSLAQYSETRQPVFNDVQDHIPKISHADFKYKHKDDISSTLFLQIYAAADYYTMNRTLMEDVPPVLVDIILDPYIFNILPRSLVPTIAYVILLAVGSWYASKYVMDWMCTIGANELKSEKKNS